MRECERIYDGADLYSYKVELTRRELDLTIASVRTLMNSNEKDMRGLEYRLDEPGEFKNELQYKYVEMMHERHKEQHKRYEEVINQLLFPQIVRVEDVEHRRVK